MGGNKVNNPKDFYCSACNYRCRDRYNFKRHCASHKHAKCQKDFKRKKKGEYECSCGKKYKYFKCLMSHKAKCNTLPIATNNIMENIKLGDNKALQGMMQKVLKENMETKRLVKKMLNTKALTTNVVVNNNITNNNIITNNKITNVLVFLNDKCKDAMNIADFIENVKITIEDLIYTKNHGYVDGVANLFIKQLSDIKPRERPIQCSDKKRMKFYIKDDGAWKRDNTHEKIDKTISGVSLKQIKHLKAWEKEHPDYLINKDVRKEWHNMVLQLMGGEDPHEIQKNCNHIKRKIIDSVDVKETIK